MSHNKPTDKALDKLRKLLAHAKSAEKMGSMAEAETFAAKIQELLDKHKLSLSEIELREEVESSIGKTWFRPTQHGLTSKRQRVLWEEELAAVIAAANYCSILVAPGTNSIWFVGAEEDRNVAVGLYAFLNSEIEHHSNKAYNRAYGRAYDAGEGTYHLRGYRASWIRGATVAIGKRFRAQREETMEEAGAGEGQSTALIRVSSVAIKKYIEEDLGVKGSADALQGTNGFSADGYVDGKQWGQDVTLARGHLEGGEG